VIIENDSSQDAGREFVGVHFAGPTDRLHRRVTKEWEIPSTLWLGWPFSDDA